MTIVSFGDKVTLNSKVRIGIDNYPEAEFGLLTGEIKEMSEIPNHQGNYIAVAYLKNGLETTTNSFLPFSEGMVGYC
ncbi:hypothetical protein EAX61_01515 [Dokdonia sinensis]|uniref:Uncharacterized protein n=1 Tax=Dokdonia sinensis TaxID=2479847 RepID=A0A3M0GMX5_9FLAO|nr:hypothetical protein [Dokdonia sinensis]RMB64082.1 hypothetical protein EAX61_01515 [Dokdonia sinensis]